MPIEHKAFPIAGLKTDESGIIEAIVSVFNNVDSGKEVVRQGFFEKSIAKKLPKGVWAHDWKQPIAKTLEAKELPPGDPMLPPKLLQLGGTYIKGQFNLDTQRGREAYSDIKFGIVDEFSIGYSVITDKKDDNTGVRELIEGDWKEWSPVLVGMNPETALISIKAETEVKAWEETANEIRYRVRDPGAFQEGSFRTITLQKSPQINAIIGRLKGETSTTIQALRFASSDWTMAEAKKWVSDHADTLKSAELLINEAKATEKLVRKCDPQDMQPGMTWCLYSQDGALMGRHATREECVAQQQQMMGTKGDLPAGLTFAEHSESVLAAVEGLTIRAKTVDEMRSKEGRTISSANRRRLQELRDALDSLLAVSEPKPREKSVVDALRLESIRLESEVLATLAGT